LLIVFALGNPFRQGEVEQLVKFIVIDAHAQIRRDSVQVCVGEKLVESDVFALGYSASFLDVHGEGVAYFRRTATLWA
jgi:hypothetical protein